MTWVAAAAIVGSSLIGADATTSAANTMAGASRDASSNTLAMFQQQQQQLAPWRTTGVNALVEMSRLLGIPGPDGTTPGGGGTGLPTGFASKPFAMDQFFQDPSYQFRLNQGMGALENAASPGGGVAGSGGSPFGGNVLKALTDYSQGAASTEYQSAFDRWNTMLTNLFGRLGSVSGTGANAAGATAGLGMDAAKTAGGFSTDAANAIAAGKIGSTNALTGAVGGVANNYLLMKLLEQMKNPGTPGLDPSTFSLPGGFGGQPSLDSATV